MQTEQFDYELPPEAIAQRPPEQRDGGRLLVLEEGGISHRRVRELAELIPPDTLLVLNDSRVLRARLLGRRSTGGKVEVFLLRRRARGEGATIERWEALTRANKSLPVGTQVEVGSGLSVRIASERGAEGVLDVELEASEGVTRAIERLGHVPLPPYVRRGDDAADRERYQTVFARHLGSVAAPTAGLHLTRQSLATLRSRGVEVAHVTLHVGLGTFKPVSADDLDDHPMHSERFSTSKHLAERVAAARRRGAPVVAVGTTVVRALEAAADPNAPGCIRQTEEDTELLIQPGYSFRVVDALVTNFHQPRSTLLALVSAFASRERVLDAYRMAVAEGYRFLSYGDAMWIPRRFG